MNDIKIYRFNNMGPYSYYIYESYGRWSFNRLSDVNNVTCDNIYSVIGVYGKYKNDNYNLMVRYDNKC